MPRKRSEQNRQDVIAFLREGASRRQAAARVGVSAATAVRWARDAGFESHAPRALTPAKRAALRAAMAAGARPADAAERFQVSRSAAARLAPSRQAHREEARAALRAALSTGLSRRRAAEALGLSVATAIRWARGFDDVKPSAPSPRRPHPPRGRPDREAEKAQLLAAIDSGLSKRRAAAKLGLPVATAIRWASAAGR